MRNYRHLAALAALFHLSTQQGVTIYDNSRVACSFNFLDPTAIFGYTSETFPADWDVAVGSSANPPGFTYVCTFPIIDGTNLVQTVATQVTQNPVPNTLVIPFPSVTVASLLPDGTVTCTVGAGYPMYNAGFSFIESFALQPNPTPVTQDTVILVPTVAVTTTTSTSTLTLATETTTTPVTVTSTVATGTSTVLAKSVLTTKTFTITLPPRRTTVVSIATTTTTLSCLPAQRKMRRENRYENGVYDAAYDLFGRDAGTETPSCFSAISTPTVYNTILSTTTTGTDTVANVVFATTTSTDTITAAAPTSFSNVLATTTQTPTRTRYWFAITTASPVTKTFSLTKTVTKVPKGLTACSKGTPVPQPPKCKNPVVTTKNGCHLQHC